MNTFNIIGDYSPIAVLVVKYDLTITYANEEATILLKKPLRELIGSDLSKILFFDKPGFIPQHQRVMRGFMELDDAPKTTEMSKRTVSYQGKQVKISLRNLKIEGEKYCAAFIEDKTEEEAMKNKIDNLTSIQDKVQLIEVDTRKIILTNLFRTVIAFAVMLILYNGITGKRLEFLEVLLAGITGSLTSTTATYFESKNNDQ